ncbi:hypothetical protein AVEN_164190-1 [Araneus ventricosus]|uniref:Uncharacterized protein n=1 Tax=Araneus ventricosus TaxID=182803 RepID=A0A4Y2KDZ9_ARAVE|nr:hypothetical protein AVEN_164190-1 [Araneus ventricosus]
MPSFIALIKNGICDDSSDRGTNHHRHGKSLPSNASLMVGKRVLQGEAWGDLSYSYGTHDLGDLATNR